jgi:hypothetical protein
MEGQGAGAAIFNILAPQARALVNQELSEDFALHNVQGEPGALDENFMKLEQAGVSSLGDAKANNSAP